MRTHIYAFVSASIAAGAFLAACGGGSGQASPAPVQNVAITEPPQNAVVTVGQTATFSVAATGSAPLSYQWLENGTPITGATASTYTTPATTLGDSGEVISVTISNPGGTETSAPANLAVLTGPAPKAGDLRLQQVDAPFTVNGYAGYVSINIGGGIEQQYGAYGSPLQLGDTCGPATQGTPYNCSWFLQVNQATPASADLKTSYQDMEYSGFASDLAAGFSTGSAAAFPLPVGSSVITSLQLQPDFNAYAISSIQSTQASGFDLGSQTVAPTAFQAASTQEGAASRVITAVSFNQGNITYLSYGWQGDTTTVYEVQSVITTFADIQTAAQNLAANGYIITATGGDSTNGIVLVGTRVQGNTAARQLLIDVIPGAPESLSSGGYAMVGGFFQATGPSSGITYWIGER